MRLVGIITIAVVGAFIIFCGITCMTCAGLIGIGQQTMENATIALETEQETKEATLPDSGIEIMSITAVEGRYSDYLNVTIHNVSDKAVKSVEVDITMCDEFGDDGGTFGNVNGAKILDPDDTLEPGQSKTGKLYLWSWTYRYPKDPKVSRVLYGDETIWPDDYYAGD